MSEKTNTQSLIEEIISDVLSSNQSVYQSFLEAIITSYQTEEYKTFPVPLVLLMNEAYKRTICMNSLIEEMMKSITTYHVVKTLEKMNVKDDNSTMIIDELESDTQMKFGGA